MLIKKVRKEQLPPAPSQHISPPPHVCMLTTVVSCLGCRCPQAPRAQPQGQGLQVPPHSDRVPYPPSGPLLQDRRCPAPHLALRGCHRFHSRRLSDSRPYCCCPYVSMMNGVRCGGSHGKSALLASFCPASAMIAVWYGVGEGRETEPRNQTDRQRLGLGRMIPSHTSFW